MGFSETFGLAIPAIFRNGDIRLSLFATLAQFGTAEDLPLDDLRIELYFPRSKNHAAAQGDDWIDPPSAGDTARR